MTFSSALVTGGNGFLGHALVARLRASGRAVTALVRRPDVVDDAVDLIVADLRRPESVRAALAGQRFDVVFHLAAAGVAPRDREPGPMFATNAVGTGTLVEACAGAHVPAIVYAGSCSEYAPTSSTAPLAEDTPLTTSHLYGASKAAGGLWGSAVARSLGVNFCWLRFFGIFGPGEAPDRLVPHLANKLQQGQPVDLTPGEQVRDLMYVDDAVTALLLAADLAARGESGPFNVCTGVGTRVRDIACSVADALRRPRELLRFGALPYRGDEPMRLVGDPGRFQRAAGFAPRIDLDRGVELAAFAAGSQA
jgi:nucleoside-diphosphate-sugar epimerase